MYERFTDRARKVMQLANQEAQRFNHEYIGTEHILLGLVKEGSGVAADVLKNLGIYLRRVRREVEKIVHSGPDMLTMGTLPQTPRVKKVIEYSIVEAHELQHNYIGTEHLLLGLLREQEGIAAQVLMNLGLRLEQVREEVLSLLGHPMPKKKRPLIVEPPPVVLQSASAPSVLPWTENVHAVMREAGIEARRLKQEYIGTQHVLLGLVQEGTTFASHLLQTHGFDLDWARRELERFPLPFLQVPVSGDRLPETARVKNVIAYATEEAQALGHKVIGTEHLLLGLLHEEEGVAAQLLQNLGFNPQTLRREILFSWSTTRTSQWLSRLYAQGKPLPPGHDPLRTLAADLEAQLRKVRTVYDLTALSEARLFVLGFAAAAVGHGLGVVFTGTDSAAITGGVGVIAILLTLASGLLAESTRITPP